MFEQITNEIEKKLDDLQEKMKRCCRLIDTTTDAELKHRLEQKKDEFSEAIDRAAICQDILNYNVSVYHSDDYKEVKFV